MVRVWRGEEGENSRAKLCVSSEEVEEEGQESANLETTNFNLYFILNQF